MGFWHKFGDVLGIVAGLLTLWGSFRRWRKAIKSYPKNEPITLGPLTPKGYDPKLARCYLKRLQAQNALIEFPGALHDLPLDKLLITPRLGARPDALLGYEIPVPPKASTPDTDNTGLSPDSDVESQLQEGLILSWAEIRQVPESFIVMGPTGAGKTTLLRHEASFLCAHCLAQAAPKWNDPDLPIPVILTAAEVARVLGRGKKLRDAVRDEIVNVIQGFETLDQGQLKSVDDCVDIAWSSGSIRMLLDALDEITDDSHRKAVLAELQSHLRDEGCPFILVSHPFDPPTFQQTSRTLYLAPFNVSGEIPLFVDHWFRDINEKQQTRDNLKALIEENPRLASVCRTPLLLAFLCLAAEHGDIEAFKTRVELYQHLLKGLLETWPTQLKPAREFPAGVKNSVLSHIGWLEVAQPHKLVDRELIPDLIDWSKGTYRWDYTDASKLLIELAEVDCVLHIRSSYPVREYSFFHPTVAAYYAAMEATNNEEAQEKLLDELAEVRWHGTFTMFVSMSSNPLPLISRAADVDALSSSAQASLIDSCVSECGDRLSVEDLAECIWISQSVTPLPWTSITSGDDLSMALERLVDDDASRNMYSLINEIRDRRLTLPDREGAKPPLGHGFSEALAGLESPYDLTRWAAMWILAAAGAKSSAPRVAKLLNSRSASSRGMAAWLLSVLQDKSSCGSIRELLHDPDWTVRNSAASSLGRLGDDAALDELLGMARNDRLSVRISAAWALSKLAGSGTLGPEKLKRLRDFFSQNLDPGSHPDIMSCACSGIAALAKAQKTEDLHDYLPRITELLDLDYFGLRGSAAYAISNLAKESDRSLLESMAGNADPRIRASAASGLGRLRHNNSCSLIINLLKDRDSRVQRAAKWALYQLPDQDIVETAIIHAINAVDDKNAVPFLVSLLGHGSSLSDRAATTPKKPYSERPAIAAAIRDRVLGLLQSSQPATLASACVIIQRLPDPRAIVPGLKLLEDPESIVRASACGLFNALPDPRAIEPCIRLLNDQDARVRASALSVLQRQPDPRAIVPGLKLLEDPEAIVRASACGLFKTLPDPRAIEPCIRLFNDQDARVRASALNVLQRQPDPRAIVPGLKLLEDPEAIVRASACGLFNALPDLRAIVPGLKLLEDPESIVRASACGLFNALPDPRAIEPCIRLLNDQDARVRASALSALQRQPDPRAIVPGLKLLEDPEAIVRASACGLAAHVTIPPKLYTTVSGVLKKLLIDDPDERVRQSARFAINRLHSS